MTTEICFDKLSEIAAAITSWLGFANEDLRASTTSGTGSLVADEADS